MFQPGTHVQRGGDGRAKIQCQAGFICLAYSVCTVLHWGWGEMVGGYYIDQSACVLSVRATHLHQLTVPHPANTTGCKWPIYFMYATRSSFYSTSSPCIHWVYLLRDPTLRNLEYISSFSNTFIDFTLILDWIGKWNSKAIELKNCIFKKKKKK